MQVSLGNLTRVMFSGWLLAGVLHHVNSWVNWLIWICFWTKPFHKCISRGLVAGGQGRNHAGSICLGGIWLLKSVPISAGPCMYGRKLLEAGKTSGFGHFGTDAQRLLRLDDGTLICISHDTDGLTNPFEAACQESLVAWINPFLSGQRSLKNSRRTKSLNRKSWGLCWIRISVKLPKECNWVIENGEIGRSPSTSISLSEYLNGDWALPLFLPEKQATDEMYSHPYR